MRIRKYKPGSKIIIDLPQYNIEKGIAKIISYTSGIYEVKISKEVVDHEGNIKTILFLPEMLVHKNSKIKYKPKPKKKGKYKNKSTLLENPDPENIAYVHKYTQGDREGQTRVVPIGKAHQREDRVCPECGKEFPNSVPHALGQHIFRMHTKEGKYPAWGKEAKKRWANKKRQRGKTKGQPGTRSPTTWTTFNCAACGKQKEIRIVELKRRKKGSKSGNIYCSRKCSSAITTANEVKTKLLQQAIIEAEYKCSNCKYELNFDMYYIKTLKQVGYSVSLENVIVLCKNCRELWETGEATVDPIGKCLIMKEDENEEKEGYSIDMDKILEEIGDVDELLEDE